MEIIILLGLIIFFLIVRAAVRSGTRKDYDKLMLQKLETEKYGAPLRFNILGIFPVRMEKRKEGAKPPSYVPPDAGNFLEADTTECPYCAETIKKKAVVCKHCGRDIVPDQVDETAREG